MERKSSDRRKSSEHLDEAEPHQEEEVEEEDESEEESDGLDDEMEKLEETKRLITKVIDEKVLAFEKEKASLLERIEELEESNVEV